MGVRFPSVQSSTFVGPLPASAAETIVCGVGPLNPSIDGAPVLIFWSMTYTPGTSNTAAIFTLRRGNTLAGVAFQLQPWQTPVTAGARVIASGWYPDSPGVVAEQVYILTIQQVAATVAGTLPDVSLIAMVL